jgi:MerR family transcriptional regulator, copper efflux regulator
MSTMLMLITREAIMNIGQAAAAAGVSAKMIRHYESIGVLPKAGRTESNYRVYRDHDVHTLRFIRRARSLGFPMADVKELVSLWRNTSRPSSAVKKVAGRHVNELKEKIAGMQAMVQTLEHLARHCHGDHRPECPILDDLERHSKG